MTTVIIKMSNLQYPDLFYLGVCRDFMLGNIPGKLHINLTSVLDWVLLYAVKSLVSWISYQRHSGQTNSRNKDSSVYLTDKIFRCLLYQRIGTEDHMENQFCTCNPLFSMFVVALLFWPLYLEQYSLRITVLFQSRICLLQKKQF